MAHSADRTSPAPPVPPIQTADDRAADHRVADHRVDRRAAGDRAADYRVDRRAADHPGSWPDTLRHGCRSMVVRLPHRLDRAAMERTVAVLTGALGLPPGQRVWTQTVPARADEQAARLLLARESARVLPVDGSPLRLTVLSYRDEVDDLILLTRHAALDHAGLCRLAATLTAASPVPPGPRPAAPPLPDLFGLPEPAARQVPTVGSVPGAAPAGAVQAWGLGEPKQAGRCGALPLPVHPDWTPSVLAAATWLVLSRYADDEPTPLAVVRCATEEARGDDVAAVAPDPGTAVVGALLAGAERWCEPGAAGPRPEACLVLVPHRPDRRYRPFLAPAFPLTMCVETDPGGHRTVAASCLFDAGVVHPTIAAQFVRHVGHVADQLGAAAPDLDLDRIDLLPAAEVAETLAAGATPAPPSAGPATAIHEAFRAVAERQPDRPAVSGPGRTLTYRQLEQAAEATACGLRAMGVRPGDRVGVCLDRTPQLVVTLLAVLKAGAAYVPLDPHHPADRLRYIAADAGVRLVVAEPGACPATEDVRVVGSAELAAGRGVGRGSAPGAGTGHGGGSDPGDAAYVIYTSGSTGRPKGVVVPHRNVHALIAAVAGMNLGDRDVWTLFHASSFDFSVWEIWGCLLTGGRLVVVPYLVTRSPGEFHDLLASERVTVLSQTPSAFTNLLEADARASADLAVRLVIFGGEPLDVRLLGGWFRRHPHTRCRIVNMFGITETTVHVTAKTVTPLEVSTHSRSVGRALPGWSVSVRDPQGRVLPPGVAGEIYVGGAGVASHYLNREELTAQRFIHDPASGQRVYRSGDRGRMLLDGEVAHLGRLDGQVKVRGFRVELEEIRSVLLDDPAVAAAVVVLDDGGGDPARVRIHVYAVLNPGGDPAQVRRRAGGMLPDYMTPATVTALPALPLTGNGKLDTALLPPPGRVAPNGAGSHPRAAAPRPSGPPAGDDRALEHAVSRVWRKVLGVPVRAEDDFFDLGGNSLLAVRLLAAMRDAGLPTVSVRELYLNRTVTRLSELLETSR